MLRLAALFFPLTLVACAEGDDIEMNNDPGDDPDTTIGLTIEGDNPFDDPATLFLEFTEEGKDVGDAGWHLELAYDHDISFDATGDELQDMLTDAGHSVIYSRVECIRLQVELHGPDENRYACEGSHDDATLVLDLDVEWGGVDQDLDTWSDPYGNGCSPSFCK
jgi:hypothetical protein